MLSCSPCYVDCGGMRLEQWEISIRGLARSTRGESPVESCATWRSPALSASNPCCKKLSAIRPKASARRAPQEERSVAQTWPGISGPIRRSPSALRRVRRHESGVSPTMRWNERMKCD